jgi:hypothetical protein
MSIDSKEVTGENGRCVNPLFATLLKVSGAKIPGTGSEREHWTREVGRNRAQLGSENGFANGRKAGGGCTVLPDKNYITSLWKIKRELEARGGIEPPIMVLQTIALLLGDRALDKAGF